MQEDEVGHALLLGAVARLDAPHGVVVDALVLGGVGLRIAPAQVGREHVAREVVRRQAADALLDERQRAQPREQLCRLLGLEHRAQQLLGRDARLRADLERAAVLLARHGLDEQRDERAHHVGRVGEPEPQHVVGRACLGRPLRDDVGEQRERERMAVRDVGDVLGEALRQARTREVRADVGEAEVAQRHDAHELAPCGIRRPRRGGRAAAGDHDERVGRQLGQEPLAQPGLERRGLLERVEQQHEATAVADGACRAGARPERGREGGWRRLDAEQVQAQRGDACVRRGVRHRRQQGALADAARAMDEEPRERRRGVRQRRPEELELGLAPDEAPAPCDDEAVGDAVGCVRLGHPAGFARDRTAAIMAA